MSVNASRTVSTTLNYGEDVRSDVIFELWLNPPVGLQAFETFTIGTARATLQMQAACGLLEPLRREVRTASCMRGFPAAAVSTLASRQRRYCAGGHGTYHRPQVRAAYTTQVVICFARIQTRCYFVHKERRTVVLAFQTRIGENRHLLCASACIHRPFLQCRQTLTGVNNNTTELLRLVS